MIHMISFMRVQDIEPFLKENAYPFYTNGLDKITSKWQDDMYRAYLHSLPKDILSQLIEKWMGDDECPRALYYKAIGVMKSKVREEMAAINTSTLLKWYADKKSGKVSIAIRELMDRYRGESVENQLSILKAFIMGGKKEMEWAGRRLRDHWSASLATYVDIRWKATHNPILGYVILRHFPDDYVLAEQEELAVATKYAYVSARLGKVKGFQMDSDGLSTPDFLYVMAKWEMGKSKAINIEAIADAMLDEYFDEEENITPKDVSLILWSLGKLGLTESIIRQKPALEKLQKKEEEFRAMVFGGQQDADF